MRIKLSMVLVVIFLLVLSNCSLFEDPNPVNITEPKEGDVLLKGENFWVFADIDPEYSLYSVCVELLLITEDSTYDSTLWECNFSEEGVSVIGDLSIGKELTVPLDAPVNDNYSLQVGILYGGFGHGNSIPVRVRSSND